MGKRSVVHLAAASLIVLTVGSGFGWQSPQGEAATIRETLEDYLAARNARDARAVAGFFAEDYDQANLTMGRIQIHSGEERARAYEEAFAESRIQNDMRSEVENVRLLTEDVALLDTELAFVDDTGRPQFHNYATFVFVKRDGRWLIGAVRLAPYAKNAPGR